jgi:hypothetical protein
MKKKFVLTLALVLMVAATLVAAPVTLTGSFKAGYVMEFDGGLTTTPYDITASSDLEMSVDALSLSADFWSLDFGDINFDDDNIGATISIYLDKALAEQGVDMGDISLTFEVGNQTTLSTSYVYADDYGYVGDNVELEMAGAVYSSALTIGYGSMFSVYAGADLATTAATMPVVLGVKVMPVDGISATAAYTNIDSNSVDGAFAASACVDIATLAGLDFGLMASAYDIYYLDNEDNNLFAELSASYDMVSAWVEYQLLDTTSNLNAQIDYSVLDFASVYALVELADLSNIAATYTVGGSVFYTMGGVTYNCDADFDITNTVLTVTPTVAVSF